MSQGAELFVMVSAHDILGIIRDTGIGLYRLI